MNSVSRNGRDATAGFGGALPVAADGTLVAAWPLHTEGSCWSMRLLAPQLEGRDDQPGSTAGTARQLRSGMPVPDLTVVAEGETARGERWSLKAGGSAQDYYTLLETIYPDGHHDEGGMGGPAIYPRSLFNVYTGRADEGPLRVIVRADRRVRRLRFQSGQDERCDLLPAADAPAMGVTLFAVPLPWTTGIASMQGLDDDGQVVSP